MNRLEKRQLKPHWLQRRRRLLGGEEVGGFAEGGIPEAPLTGGPWGRYESAWVEVPPEAPKDGQTYGRSNDAWVLITGGGGGGIDQATADARYVNIDGDTMTGPLVLPASGTPAATVINFGGAGAGIHGNATTVYINTGGTAKLTTGTVAITASIPLRETAGSVTAPSYSFSTETNSGFYRSAAGVISLSSLGTETMRWTGADNSILAIGPLMVSGDPLVDLQVAPKQYVDNKFLAVATGAVIADTAPTAQQGKLWWESDAGGLWLSYNDGNSTQWIGVGGNVAQGNFVSKGGDTITGNISITSPTASGTPTSGALVVTGGVGIGGALNIAGAVNHNSTTQMGAALTLLYNAPSIILDRLAIANNNLILGKVAALNKWGISLGDSTAMSGGNVGANFAINRYADTTGALLDSPLSIMRDTGRVILSSTVASSSPTTGALTVNGGVGVGGDIRIGGAFHGGSAFAATGPIVTLQLRCSVAGTGNGCAISMATDTNTKWWFGYRSALYGTAYDDNFIGWNPDAGPFLEITQLTGQIKLPKTTASTSYTSGALIVSGGVGIGGALNVSTASKIGNVQLGNDDSVVTTGGIMCDATNIALRAASSNTIYFQASGAAPGNYGVWSSTTLNLSVSTVSTSTTTGALVVAGGVGIGGALHTNGSICVKGPSLPYANISVRFNGTGEIGLVFDDSFSVASSTFINFLRANGATTLGNITNNANVGITYNTTSDVRGKPNREPLSPDTARSIIDALEVFDFDKDGNAIRGVGLVAQQAHSVHKSLATPGRNEDDWWMAEKAAPMPFVIANLQLLNKLVDQLMKAR